MKRTYRFGNGTAEGDASMKNLLGGKGANLAEMSSLGMPVPPGFTITTEACIAYLATQKRRVSPVATIGLTGEALPPVADSARLPGELMDEVRGSLRWVEGVAGRTFGDPENPLLVSVRSGARASMPGMMDTILNLGMNDATCEGLARQSGDARFAWDAYRRFVVMYGNVALELERASLDAVIKEAVKARGLREDSGLTADDWRGIVPRLKARIMELRRRPFPEDPHEQLEGAVRAVFASWNTPRARFYRKEHGYPEDWGTAANVQAMVFGNMGDTSATGVCFTRDPKDGSNIFFGEFLVNAQGEDVVAGLRTPQPINRQGDGARSPLPTLEEVMPVSYGELVAAEKKLEAHYKDMQDIEFTIERGKLFILQTRNGKRFGAAAVRIAVDMAEEGLISQRTAVSRVTAEHLDQLLHPTVDPKAQKSVLAHGLPASPGAATGAIVFHADDAVRWAGEGKDVILVRDETSPEDIHGMSVARGILTARGGQTSHAAVVARGMGRCCVVGCKDLVVSEREKTVVARGSAANVTLHEGDVITLDGGTGEVLLGRVAVTKPDPEKSGLFTLLQWADGMSRMKVRANADTPEDAQVARRHGAVGIGLCRTEHMFFEGDRIDAVREMILAEDEDGRREALDKLYPMQRGDFVGIFRAMAGLPVTIRLLDPPLHEFLPHKDSEIEELAETMRVPASRLRSRTLALRETNPMMGHRGCRLGLTHPSIYAMQVRAILDAAIDVVSEGIAVFPEIMIPLVSVPRELEIMRALTMVEAETVFERRGTRIEFKVGTMIELPRAALVADKIAAHADFFSFGTNDLTQTTFGFSRDDAGFLKSYLAPGLAVFTVDPFVSLDQDGVGELVRLGTERGRRAKPGLKVGICGEHGGDPASIGFVDGVGLDYVSCSPYRVPVARLSAARAAAGAK